MVKPIHARAVRTLLIEGELLIPPGAVVEERELKVELHRTWRTARERCVPTGAQCSSVPRSTRSVCVCVCAGGVGGCVGSVAEPVSRPRASSDVEREIGAL